MLTVSERRILYGKPDWRADSLRQMLLPSPAQITILITLDCDFSCCFCCVARSKKSVMALHNFQIVLKNIQPSLFSTLSITGGEPSMVADLPMYIEAANAAGYNVNIITNGYSLLNSDLPKSVFKAGNSVSISLHGDEKTHNAITNSKSYKNVLKSLEAVRVNNGRGRILYTLTKYNSNLDSIEYVYDIAVEKGLDFFLARVNSINDGKGCMVPISDLEKVAQFVADKKANSKIKVGFSNPIPPCVLPAHLGATVSGCSSGYGFVSVRPDGALTICSESAESIGNIFQQPLSELWGKGLHKQWIDRFEAATPLICANCEHIVRCRRGCKIEDSPLGDFYLREHMDTRWGIIRERKYKLKKVKILKHDGLNYFCSTTPSRFFNDAILDLVREFRTASTPADAFQRFAARTQTTPLEFYDVAYSIIDMIEIGVLYESQAA